MKDNIFDEILENTFNAKKMIEALRTEIYSLSDIIVQYIQNNKRIFFVGIGITPEILTAIINELDIFNIDTSKLIPISATKIFSNSLDGYKELEDIAPVTVFEMDLYKITKDDLVIGLSISGKTKYTYEILRYASNIGCKTAIISCGEIKSDLNINNIISLKYEKFSLNLFTVAEGATLFKIIIDLILYSSMEKMGRIWKGNIIYFNPVSAKIDDYCIKVIEDNFNFPFDKALKIYNDSKKSLAVSLVMIIKNVSYDEANSLIIKNKYNINKII